MDETLGEPKVPATVETPEVAKVANKNNKWTMIVLVVLVIAIVGLVVGILIVHLTGGNGRNADGELVVIEGDETKCKGESINKNAEEISKCIRDDYEKKVEEEGGEEVKTPQVETDIFDEYTSAINQLKEQGDYREAGILLVDKFDYAYLEMDDCGLAMDLIDEENIDDYPEDVRSYINSMAWSLFIECQDRL